MRWAFAPVTLAAGIVSLALLSAAGQKAAPGPKAAPTPRTADGHVEQPKFTVGDDPTTAFTTEIQAAVDGIVAGKEPALLSGQLARDALVMCHRECESVRTGKAVRVQ